MSEIKILAVGFVGMSEDIERALEGLHDYSLHCVGGVSDWFDRSLWDVVVLYTGVADACLPVIWRGQAGVSDPKPPIIYIGRGNLIEREGWDHRAAPSGMSALRETLEKVLGLTSKPESDSVV